MIKISTHSLSGRALEWAVAQCEGMEDVSQLMSYTTNWAQAGPIIDRFGISIACTLVGNPVAVDPIWRKSSWYAFSRGVPSKVPPHTHFYGGAPLLAAMKAYVGICHGETIEIPKKLRIHCVN